MAFRKLPPDVARELLRHVKPLQAKVHQAEAGKKNGANMIPLLACVGFVGCAASIPYIATQWVTNLSDRDEALTPAQVRRGAFGNSGSRDAGKDPNWNWKEGRYVYPPGFAEHLKKQDPEHTDFGPDLGPVVREEQKKRQAQAKA
jgi:hypothetical protein